MTSANGSRRIPSKNRVAEVENVVENYFRFESAVLENGGSSDFAITHAVDILESRVPDSKACVPL
jgi:hypothetical protein